MATRRLVCDSLARLHGLPARSVETVRCAGARAAARRWAADISQGCTWCADAAHACPRTALDVARARSTRLLTASGRVGYTFHAVYRKHGPQQASRLTNPSVAACFTLTWHQALSSTLPAVLQVCCSLLTSGFALGKAGRTGVTARGDARLYKAIRFGCSALRVATATVACEGGIPLAAIVSIIITVRSAYNAPIGKVDGAALTPACQALRKRYRRARLAGETRAAVERVKSVDTPPIAEFLIGSARE
jgi:hypothetical protein